MSSFALVGQPVLLRLARLVACPETSNDTCLVQGGRGSSVSSALGCRL